VIPYLIESAICFLILYMGYLLLLRKLSIFKFNRFYLLFSILAALVIPVISIQIVRVPLPAFEGTVNTLLIDQLIHEEAFQPVSKWSWSTFVLVFYLVISACFVSRFVWNLVVLIIRSRTNRNVNFRGNKIVLLESDTAPHVFMNTVFLSRKDFGEGRIDADLLNHELAHKNQLHSIDILIIELVLALFWFNPVVWLLRRAIYLNHEYLADEVSLSYASNVKDYSHKIIDYTFKLGSARFANGLKSYLPEKRLLMIQGKGISKRKSARLILLAFVVIGLILLIACEGKQNGSISDSTTSIVTSESFGDSLPASIVMKNDLKMTISFDSVTRVGQKAPDFSFDQILNAKEAGKKVLSKEVIQKGGLEIGTKKLLNDEDIVIHLTFAEVEAKLLMIKCQYKYIDNKKYDSMIQELAYSLINLD